VSALGAPKTVAVEIALAEAPTSFTIDSKNGSLKCRLKKNAGVTPLCCAVLCLNCPVQGA
jgi:hypothetical protein